MRTTPASALPELSAMHTRAEIADGSRFDRATRGRVPCKVRSTSRSEALEIVPGILGNHLAVEGFLQRSLHRPSSADFAELTGRPGYDPAERRIVRSGRDRSLVAHMRLEPQVMRFGSVEIPLVRLRELAVLPEYAQEGLGHRMVEEAEDTARAMGAMLLMARGEQNGLLHQHNWSSLGCDPVSIVSPQRLLGQLPAAPRRQSLLSPERIPLGSVRIARLTDIDSLRAVYEQQAKTSYGPWVRSEPYWSWLVNKHAHNRIYLYSEGDEPLAYAVIRCASVLELVDRTRDCRGAARLLELAGADAIEQGRHTLRIHAPARHPAHAWAGRAHGGLLLASAEERWMVKVVSLRGLIRRLATEFHRRVKSSPDPLELSVRIGRDDFLVKRGVRSMRITRDSAPERIELSERAAVQLFLGHRGIAELVENRSLVASSGRAMDFAERLFPKVDLWRTDWDDAPVLVDN